MIVRTLLTLLVIANVQPAAGCELVVTDAWLRPAPPTAHMRAAFVSFQNRGATDCVIIGATSTAFASVSLHRTTMIDGVARMRPLDSLTIPAGGNLHMAPGGIHVMLMAPADGALDAPALRFEFDDGDHLDVVLRQEGD